MDYKGQLYLNRTSCPIQNTKRIGSFTNNKTNHKYVSLSNHSVIYPHLRFPVD